LPFYDFFSPETLRCSCPRGVDLISDTLPFRSALVWRAERDQQGYRTRRTAAVHMMLWSAFMMTLATWLKHTSTRAILRSSEFRRFVPEIGPWSYCFRLRVLGNLPAIRWMLF